MKKSEKKLYEIDLYEPVQQLFVKQGYAVYGEVNDCDIVAIKDEEPIIVELKLTVNMELLLQAAKRQRIAEKVYIAIPKPSYSLRSQKWRDLSYLIRRLELGLIFVQIQECHAEAKIINEPTPFNREKSMRQSKKRRNKLIKEVESRSGNYNIGGSSRTKIMTAYRENCIFIAVCLHKYGPLSPKQLREIGTGDKTPTILRANYYGWFERIQRGVYDLSEKGLEEYVENQEVLLIYANKINNSSFKVQRRDDER